MPMKSLTFVFAIHNHQPIGNFRTVFEEAHARSYQPFLAVMEKHPTVKFTTHWSGPLLEWLVAHHPESIELMREMVRRGQLELLTGAYYEAILAIIPEADRIGQIRKLSSYIEQLFDYKPKGIWLAERVWEQSLVPSLVEAGVEYVLVDDTHFRHAGLHDEDLLGYYYTEDNGAALAVLPMDKTLRYALPFRSVNESLHYFQRIASEREPRMVIHADDGEKFGVWPKTFDTVYTHRWLESFCTMLEEHRWIASRHLADVVNTLAPLGRIYLPTASYSEMMKWALNPTAFLQLEAFEQQLKECRIAEENSMFVRGGYWRNFLAKYPEANHMHKKMLRVSARAHRLAARRDLPQRVWDHLWAGQCNDAYWHGVFGGLYLPNLRFPVYQHLLRAETELDALESLPSVRVEETDFDCDGSTEVLIESDQMNLYFKPSVGGSLVELDFKPLAFNVLDVLSRREEGYHRRLMAKGGTLHEDAAVHDGVLVKELGLEQHLHFDWYRHASLVDHFFGKGTTLDDYARCAYLELGDFVNQPFHYTIERTTNGILLTLERAGALWFDGKPHRLALRKCVRFDPSAAMIDVEYTLKNLEARPIEAMFGVEFCLGLMAGDAHDRFYRIEGRTLRDARLRSIDSEEEVGSVRVVDDWLGLSTRFTFDPPALLWRHPIETVSLSESGFERLYQCSVVTPIWKTTLANQAQYRIVQTIETLSPSANRSALGKTNPI